MWFWYFSEHKFHISCILYLDFSWDRLCNDNLTNQYKVWCENGLMWVSIDGESTWNRLGKRVYRKVSLPCLLSMCEHGWCSGDESPWCNVLHIDNTQYTDIGGHGISLLPLHAQVSFLLVKRRKNVDPLFLYTIVLSSNPVKAVIRRKSISQVKRELSCPNRNYFSKNKPGLLVSQSYSLRQMWGEENKSLFFSTPHSSYRDAFW